MGNIAFVADDAGGLQLINISNPSDLQPLGNYAANVGRPQASSILDANAFIAAGNGGLQIINFSDTFHPTLLDSYDFNDGTDHIAHDIEISGNYAYIADGTGGLKIVTTAKNSIFNTVATDAIKNEGNDGNTTFTFTVTRSGDIANSCSVDYQIGNYSTGINFFYWR